MFPAIDRITIFTNRQDYQESHAGALAAGVRAHGITPVVQRNATAARGRYVACWGWRPGRMLRDRRHEVLVMERGYLGDRFRWTSLAWNGLNGRGQRWPSDDPSRFDQHFRHLLKPWNDGGDYVLLIGQVPGDASLGGMHLGTWYENTARHAHRAYGLPVRFRPHPVAIKRGYRANVSAARTINGTLDDALAHAAVAITFNSNTAVEAVMAGVPTITADRGSMAWEVTAHKIGEVCKPDREAWAARLAWCQWTMDEIRSGYAWEHISPRESLGVAA